MKEQISALMDDEIDPDDAQHLFKALGADSSLARCWSVYHAIGDTMRGAAHFSPDFHERFMARLEAEPTVLAPPPSPRRRLSKSAFAMSAAASVAAVLFVGWAVFQQQLDAPAPNAAAPMVAENNVSAEALDSYLMAHHELSPDSGMQTAYYVRAVAMTGEGK